MTVLLVAWSGSVLASFALGVLVGRHRYGAPRHSVIPLRRR